MAERAANHLVLRWGTRHFVLPDSMKAPFMRMVRLPDLDKHRVPPSDPNDPRVKFLFTLYFPYCFL